MSEPREELSIFIFKCFNSWVVGLVITGSYRISYSVDSCNNIKEKLIQQTYNEISALLMYHWACILQQVTSHHLQSSNRVDLPAFGSGADRQSWLLPALIKVECLWAQYANESRRMHWSHFIITLNTSISQDNEQNGRNKKKFIHTNEMEFNLD